MNIPPQEERWLSVSNFSRGAETIEGWLEKDHQWIPRGHRWLLVIWLQIKLTGYFSASFWIQFDHVWSWFHYLQLRVVDCAASKKFAGKPAFEMWLGSFRFNLCVGSCVTCHVYKCLFQWLWRKKNVAYKVPMLDPNAIWWRFILDHIPSAFPQSAGHHCYYHHWYYFLNSHLKGYSQLLAQTNITMVIIIPS